MAASKNNKIDGMIEVKNTKSRKPISVWVYMYMALRSYFLQNAFNYANYQGVGYAYTIYPGLVKVYGKGTDALKRAVIENIEFFNSNPQTLPLITSVQIKMLEAGRTFQEARAVKMALMGPLSGIGDSMSQYGWYPLFATIAVGMAQQGDVTGPIIFLIAINGVNLSIKMILGYFGYKLGTDFVKGFSSKMEIIIKVSTIVGIIVISALAVKFTHFEFALKTTRTIIDVHGNKVSKVISVQSFIDNTIPFLMPGIWVTTIYLCIKKFHWSVYRVILFTLVFGMTAGVFGILG